jgi:NAD(P)-dependent dehydrogenase (short-subunit alcohol dehydrogenase family)
MTTNPQQVTVVTGGGQGIGKAIASRFLEASHSVVIAEIDEDAGSETVDELQGERTISSIATDVSREDEVETLMAQTIHRFGRIDNLINNAGISCNKPITELSLDEWNNVLSTNLTGAFLCSKYATPYLIESQGNIVNICSTRARMSEPHTEAYAASKGGIHALTHALAMSLGPAVRVNSISPGWVEVRDWKKRAARIRPELSPADHAQHPGGRVGRPQDIAELAFYLCSDKAGFITAQDFVVDGGMTKKMVYVT